MLRFLKRKRWESEEEGEREGKWEVGGVKGRDGKRERERVRKSEEGIVRRGREGRREGGCIVGR